MIGEQIQVNSDGTLTISCKVPAKWLPLLNTICAVKGATMNDLIKMCLQFLIETARVTTEPSPDMKVLLQMVKIDSNWQQMFNYLNNGQFDIAQMILVLQQSKDGKPCEGFTLAKFDKPYCGDCQQSLCVDDILERVIEVALGASDYWDLRKIAQHFEAASIREALVRMVDAQAIMDLNEADREELPQVGDFHDYGKVIEYGAKTRRKRHRTPDSLANSQQRIQFDDFDREQADYEVGEREGEHRGDGGEPPVKPFGGEW